MALSVDWSEKIVFIPKDYLIYSGGSLYILDTEQFRLDIHLIMQSEEGIVNDDIINHNTVVIIDGVPYARSIEIINDYTITFEDGQYRVKLIGSNNNILTVTNLNQVSVASGNSAGLVDNSFGQNSVGTDVNVVSVGGTSVTSPNDLKADIVEIANEVESRTLTVDLSTIPQSVWEYVTRELTVAAGLTPEQEAKLDTVINDITNIDSKLDNIECDTGTEWTVSI